MMLRTLVTALALAVSSYSAAAVSPAEADKLGSALTPLGGELAGNTDGSIPAWTGGLGPDAGQMDAGGFLSNPFASEQPLFTINADNYTQYESKLAPGQVALLKRYPQSFVIKVYPSHRTARVPQAINEAAKRSALNTQLLAGGNGLKNFADSRYYAFPIPQNGLEVVWNHITRYRGGNLKRNIVQATPQTNGAFTIVRFEDEVAFPGSMPDLAPERASNALLFFKQRVTAPSRLAGNVLLVHDTLDQVAEPRMAWVYNAGQRRVRRAPQVAYDGPGTASDGLRTSDNFDMFNGSPDRYDWKLIGKRELYIPYNNYELDSPKVSYEQILQAGHTNQQLARYELHRVWEVEATLKNGERNIYAKRRFYFDEDTWQIAASELYDGRGQLWRVGQAMLLQHYAVEAPVYAFEALYDLTVGRYLAIGMKNEEKVGVLYGTQASAKDFTPAALRNAGVR